MKPNALVARSVPRPRRWPAVTTAFVLVVCASARAGEVGHYAGGLPNIRDLLLPAPGFYGLVYNYFYTTDRVNDRHGQDVDSVNINPGPGPGVPVKVNVDVDLYVLSPAFIWIAPWDLGGIRYGAYVAPSFANTSVAAALSTTSGRGQDSDSSQFGVGDLFVQPVWLGLPLEHWDLAVGYGFYAPVGKYDVDTVVLPVIGPRTVEASDNIGLGFWTHQLQAAVAWYPWKDKGTAVTAALTYEIHQEKEDFDLTPGQDLSLNWGISQYVPISVDNNWLVEGGPAGYSQWQVTGDTGSDAARGDVHDQVHAVGGQLGVTYVPRSAALNVHYFYEFYSEDRFQGHVLGISLALKI